MATAPNVVQTYPADGDTGIPIGESLEIVFDRGIDLETAKHFVVLYGQDFDQTSGPDSALWLDHDTGDNPYFLKSPGFGGFVQLAARLVYVDLDTGPNYQEVDPGVITSEGDESSYGAAGVGHKLVLSPTEPLAPDVEFHFNILGDADGIDNGLGSRTIYDVEPDGGNASGTAAVISGGTYSGSTNKTVVVEITGSGDIGDAKYKWYYQADGAGSAIEGMVPTRRFQKLEDGIQIRFTGSGLVSGDIYRFNVEPIARLGANHRLTFTTGDGSYTDAPDSPSTPATSEPPSSVIPPAPGSTTPSDSETHVVGMSPQNGSFINNIDTNEITLVFDKNVDPATITKENIKVFRYPVSGFFEGQSEVEELQTELTVSGDTVSIKI